MASADVTTVRADVASSPIQKIETHSTSATLTAEDCYGKVHTNKGASGTVTLTLPTPAAGLSFEIFRPVAHSIVLNPGTGYSMMNSSGAVLSTAIKLSVATTGGTGKFLAVDAVGWQFMGGTGTFSSAG